MTGCRGAGYLFGLVIAALVLFGCGGDENSSGLTLDVKQETWDSLIISWEANEATQEVSSVQTVLYNSRYDTLFAADATKAGDGKEIAIPDSELGNKERLLVEVCGRADGLEVCAQEGLRASPKRLKTNRLDVRYPLEPSFTRGQFEADLRVERRVFGEEEAWEVLDVEERPEAYLVASVDGGSTSVNLAAGNRAQSFDLSRQSGYDDFSYDLRSAMYGGASADVRIQVRGSWNGIDETLSEEWYSLSQPSEKERLDDLHFFAQQAANQVIRRLFGDDQDTVNAEVQVESWTYDRFQDRYAAELEIRWRDQARRFRGSSHVLRGELTSTQSGRGATFQAERATRQARSAWIDAVDEGALALEPLRTNLKVKVMDRSDEEIAADSLLPAIAEN